jgi:biopolymer transport protein ExbD
MIRLPKVLLGLLVLTLLLSLAMPVLAAEAKGKIKTVTPDKQEFVLTDGNQKDWTMNLNKDGKVFINDKESKLADLQAGDEVIVTYAKEGEKLSASEVRCTRK